MKAKEINNFIEKYSKWFPYSEKERLISEMKGELRALVNPSKKCKHNPVKLSYNAWHDWSDLKIRRGHKQHFCPVCKKYFF